MLIWYFSNNLGIYEYVGKLPKQRFSVWLFSNPGDKILFLLKFNEARISEWNVHTEGSHENNISRMKFWAVDRELFPGTGPFDQVPGAL